MPFLPVCRCPTFPALTPNCSLVTDPRDECCQVPLCVNKGNNSTSIVGVPGSVYGVSLPVKNQYTGVRSEYQFYILFCFS